jgi:hypothetical protein
MSISQTAPPIRSLAKFKAALSHFSALKEKHDRWMKIRPSAVVRKQILYPHPLYSIRLIDLIAGKTLSSTLVRVGWIYFLCDRQNRLACAEVSIIAGIHRNARLTEGPFVKKAFRLIAKSHSDKRVRGHRFRLRSIRVESLHFFTLWLKGDGKMEYFIPVTPLGALLAAGQWISRKDLADALLPEAQRVRAAHERAFARIAST